MLYSLAISLIRFVAWMTIRIERHGIDAGTRGGGYLLACAHVSHLDPFCLGAIWPRKIGWMARMEFYGARWSSRCLRWLHAFPVNRQGVPVSAIRESLRRLARGEIVGIFPEGEIKRGGESVLRGGAIKRGICLLAARSGRPVLPCILVGTDKLLGVAPWLPFRRGRVWILCGHFITPIAGADRRAARAQMAAEIEKAFVHLYAELRARWQLDDSIIP